MLIDAPCRLGPLPSSGLSIHDSARCGRPLSCSRSRDRRQPGRTTPTARLGHRPAGRAWIGGLHRGARLAHTQHRAKRSLTPSRSPYSTRAMGSYCCSMSHTGKGVPRLVVVAFALCAVSDAQGQASAAPPDQPAPPTIPLPSSISVLPLPNLPLPASIPPLPLPADVPAVQLPSDIPAVQLPSAIPTVTLPSDMPAIQLPAEIPPVPSPPTFPRGSFDRLGGQRLTMSIGPAPNSSNSGGQSLSASPSIRESASLL